MIDSDATVHMGLVPMETPDRLVVLFSTQYRTWDKCAQNQIELIKHICPNLDNCIVGVHYWNDVDVPPPEPFLRLKNMKYSTSPNATQYTHYILQWFERFQLSTRQALENAEELYKLKYGEEMPLYQPILRLRPDFVVENIPNFPLPIKNGWIYYLSTWNTMHRPDPIPNKIEVVDLCLTTKFVLLQIINYDARTAVVGHDHFIEIVFYSALKSMGINVLFDANIKYGIMRDGWYYRLTV